MLFLLLVALRQIFLRHVLKTIKELLFALLKLLRCTQITWAPDFTSDSGDLGGVQDPAFLSGSQVIPMRLVYLGHLGYLPGLAHLGAPHLLFVMILAVCPPSVASSETSCCLWCLS